MLSLIVSIIALGLIVAFHEFGHFSMARLFHVGIIEYTIGLGPRICSFVKGNTRYSLRALPFGGACMMLGEEDEESEEAGRVSGDLTNGTFDSEAPVFRGDEILIDGRTYHRSEQLVNKPAWQRFLIFFGGPLFNFILAFLFALVITTNYGYDPSVITEVTEGLPAAAAGIETGDRITGLAVKKNETGNVSFSRIETARDIQMFMYLHADDLSQQKTFVFRYLDESDGEQERQAEAAPEYDEELGRIRLGFGYSMGFVPAESLTQIIHYSFYDVRYCIRSALLSVRMIFGGKVGRSDVMGPVRMVAVMDESVENAAQKGTMNAVMTLLNLMILISGSLGAMNLLPLPALDGGRIIFVLIEMLTGHAVPKRFEGMVHMVGFMLLLGLMVIILFNDVIMLIFGGGI